MGKKKNKRDGFFSSIPLSAKKILDVGCANGNWVNRLGKRELEVIGIERDEKLCAQASRNLRKVFLADVEKFDLPFPERYFDCILYADVLEHLQDPQALLQKHIRYLKEDGCAIASIPNIRYYKVILRLVLGGVWDYIESGLLDKTHLRFFTLLNTKELFANAGYKIVEVRRNIIAASGFKILNFLCFNKLKEFLVYQYYIKAIKQKDGTSLSFAKRKIIQF